MTDLIQRLHPVVQAFLATGFTWGMTAPGASLVFLILSPMIQKFLGLGDSINGEVQSPERLKKVVLTSQDNGIY